MPEEKKMTTGGFFRGLLRYALTGGQTKNPIQHVIEKGLEHGAQEAKREEAQGSIETTSEEVPSRGNSHDERAPSSSRNEET